MSRWLVFSLGLAVSVLLAADAAADPIQVSDYRIVGGHRILGPSDDPPEDILSITSQKVGELVNKVFKERDIYWYVHVATPTVFGNFTVFETLFPVVGFNYIAGWRFEDDFGDGSSEEAGGAGTSADFNVVLTPDGRLQWQKQNWPGDTDDDGGEDEETDSGDNTTWDALEPIRFFYGSTVPPVIQPYGLSGVDPTGPTLIAGSGDSWGPGPVVPEPGSLMLLGSGVLALCEAARRRRKRQM
jgi:hypothetical protein